MAYLLFSDTKTSALLVNKNTCHLPNPGKHVKGLFGRKLFYDFLGVLVDYLNGYTVRLVVSFKKGVEMKELKHLVSLAPLIPYHMSILTFNHMPRKITLKCDTPRLRRR